jgi:hypothetical protein
MGGDKFCLSNPPRRGDCVGYLALALNGDAFGTRAPHPDFGSD